MDLTAYTAKKKGGGVRQKDMGDGLKRKNEGARDDYSDGISQVRGLLQGAHLVGTPAEPSWLCLPGL